MTAVQFPQNPSEGDTFIANGVAYTFSGNKWTATSINPAYEDIQGATGATGAEGATGPASERMPGEVTMWSGSSVPSGWLECNGQSTSGFTALAAIVGANVPDLRGEFVRGWDNGRGVDSGRALLSAQSGEFESHTHIQDSHNHTQNAHAHGIGGAAAAYPVADSAASATGPLPRVSGAIINGTADQTATNIANTATNQNTGGTETRPRNISLMYIIKT